MLWKLLAGCTSHLSPFRTTFSDKHQGGLVRFIPERKLKSVYKEPWVHFVSPAGPPNSGDFETRSGRKKWSFETSREGTFGQAMMKKHEQQQQFSANFKLFSSCQAIATFLLFLNPTSCTDLKMGGYGILERLPGYFWESRCSTEGLTLGYGFKLGISGYEIHRKFDHFLSSYLIIYFWAHLFWAIAIHSLSLTSLL